ncbi:MAG TPA: hypothetical protein VJC07_05135 [Candidatus Nanoarchaeia archaeon]|nr:hypothetical protein [Candidatus Nanoarchaeia archaeon]
MEALKERTQGRLPHIPPYLGTVILPVFYEAPITPAEEQRIDHARPRTTLADRLYNGVRYSAISGLGIAALSVAHKAVEALVEGKNISEQRFDSAGYAMGIGYLAAGAMMAAAAITEKFTAYFSRKKNNGTK